MSPSEQTTSSPEVHKGLEGVVAGDTSISRVDGQHCQLIYRGYHIDELIGPSSYEEVCFLLFAGALPMRAPLAEWAKSLRGARALDPKIASLVQSFPPQADAMAIVRTVISALGVHDPEAGDDSLDVLRGTAIRTIAKMPTIVAAIGRHRTGKPLVKPKEGLGHAANFLYMLHGTEPTEAQAKALDVYFILLADHGFNASTFTARTVTGTRSDYYSAITAAIGSLKGPLHGDANRKAMEMLLEIGDATHVNAYVKKTLSDHKRFMGFGHRVYKGEDPRAKHLKAMSKQLAEASHEPKWYVLSEQLQETVWQAKKLPVNVDFYSASVLYYLGIPTALFTTMFACARMAGWSAHVIEQTADNRLIRPLAMYTGLQGLRYVPIDQRTSSSITSH